MGMVVIQPYILVSKLKKTKTKFPRCTGYLDSIKNYKSRFLANSSTFYLKAVKTVIKYCEKVYERSDKNQLGLLKINVKF